MSRFTMISCALLSASVFGGCALVQVPAQSPGPDRSAQAPTGVASSPVTDPGSPTPTVNDTYEVLGETYPVWADADDYVEEGLASWYGEELAGRPTASGEPFDPYAMTAAHRSLPLGTHVEVENLENGRTVIVLVNDRGPFHDDRLIDLSLAAAQALGFAENGTAQVEVRSLN